MLQKLAQDLGGDVHFHGRLPTGELHELVRSACVSVIPSRWYENQPLAVLESFACAVPVVGTDLGGIPELIDPGIDGDLVPANDPDALAEALAPFLEAPEAAFEKGRAGRVKVEERFSPEVHLQRLTELYSEILPVDAPHGLQTEN